MMRTKVFAWCLLFVACSSTPLTPTDPPDQPPMDGDETKMGVGCSGHTTPISTYALPDSSVGQSVTVRLDVPVHEGSVLFSTEGPDASAFSVTTTDEGTTILTFTSTESRAYAASVVATTPAGVLAHLDVTANVGASAGPLTISTAFIELEGDRFVTPSAAFTLTNTGSAPIDLEAPRVTADDGDLIDTYTTLFGFEQCPATLQPGASCTGSVTLYGQNLGCRTNHIDIPSSTNTAHVEVLLGVTALTHTFADHGTIASSSESCSGQCTTRFHDSMVTATPDPGYRFIGWPGLDCATHPTCKIPADTDHLQALFAPDFAPSVTIKFAGDAHRHVEVAGLLCDQDCTVSALRPDQRIIAAANTGSPFGGWTGACVTNGLSCDLATPLVDETATVTFNKDPNELIRIAGQSVAFLSNGDLVVATGRAVERRKIDGTLVWSHPSDSTQIVVTSNGTIVCWPSFISANILALDGDGHRLWMQGLRFNDVFADVIGENLVVTTSGNPASLTAGVVTLYEHSTGQIIWSKVVPTAVAIAADHADRLAIATTDGTTATLHRYTQAGDEVLPSRALDETGRMTFDAGDALVVATQSHLARYDAAGTLLFSKSVAGLHDAVVVGSSIVMVSNSAFPVETVSIVDASGTTTSSFAHGTAEYSELLGYPISLLSDGQSRVALLMSEGNTPRPSVQIFEIP